VEFQFTDEKNWGKKAYNGFGTALVAVFFIVFQFYLNGGTLDDLLIFLGFIPVIIGVTRGLYYMTKHEKNYIYLAEDHLAIYHGPILPRTEIYFSNIDYCSVVSNLLVFSLKNNKEKQINTDFLSEDDFALLREELKKRVKADLFRVSPHVHNRVNVKNE
jgi:hypothetical protein